MGALAHAARRGRLAVDHDPMMAKERLLADWWPEARRNPTQSVMLAHHRSDVDELNQAAHALMLRQHRLGRRAVTLGEREYRVSDQVLCRRNEDLLGLRNGMRGTVAHLDMDALIVRDHAGVDRRVPFDYAVDHLDYGYALTGHAAQGLTVDRAFVLLHDQGALQEWGYVACSRARLETRLYLGDRDILERETALREPDPAAPPERTARALQRPAAEQLATDHRGERGDTILDFVAQQRKQVDRHRERAAEQLATAQRELEDLHWWNRDRRSELETEIALHKAALERGEKKREQLRQLAERRSQTLTQARERDELTPSRRPEPLRPRLDREPPSLSIEL